MKPDVGMDFGTAIAYLVPGVIATRGISFVYPELRQLFGFGATGDSDLGIFALLVLVGIAVGMVVSAARAATIDMSFAISFAWLRKAVVALLPSQKLRNDLEKAFVYFDGKGRQDPSFLRLSSEPRLAAYLEAKAADKRPYQFYGNLIVALAVYLTGGYFDQRTLHTDHPTLLRVAFALAFLTLYGASRRSHFRYMTSVEEFNGTAGESP